MATESDEIAEVRTVLSGIKLFWCLDETEYGVTRLGGITNRVFRVDHMGEQYVLRLPGKGTADYVNRAHEEQAARAAAKAKVSPDVVFCDAKAGVLVTRLIDECVTMSAEKFRGVSGAAGRAGGVLRKLHHSGATFPERFNAFEKIATYSALLAKKNVKLPEGFDVALREAEGFQSLLGERSLAPCHCDPFCEDFLDERRSRMWIVDWEYAGMNDPLWDLGALSAGGQFSAAQDEELFAAYFGAPATAADRGRVMIYKALSGLVWTLWGLIQHANGNTARDFLAGAGHRFDRVKALMADPAFFTHVKAAGQG